MTEAGPLAVAFDDLHWADASSVDLIEHLFSVTRNCALLLVIAARPERDHPSSRLKQVAASNLPATTREITLDALSEPSNRELLAALVGPGTLPEAVVARILDAAEGNPFYLEELIRLLVDAQALIHRNGSWHFEHDVLVEIPQTVEKVILTRIDRLSPEGHAVVTAASVLGRQFDRPLLEALCEGQGSLQEALQQLLELDLIREATKAGVRGYRFKHALIQETAYRCLLKSRRGELHRRAAVALESLFPERLEELNGVVAHHYRLGAEPQRALQYYRRAAEAASRVYAIDEALRNYGGAFEMAALLGWGTENKLVGDLLLQRGRVYTQAGDIPRARGDLESALQSARAAENRVGEMEAVNELGFLLAGAADYRQAIPHLEVAMAMAKGLGDEGAEVGIRSRLSIVHTNRLELDRALTHAQQALGLARRLGDTAALARALDSLLLVAVMVGDFATVDEVAPELLAIHRNLGDLWYLQFALYQWSYVHIAAGRWGAAVERLGEAFAINRRVGDRGNEPLYPATLCWLHRSRGQYQDALETGRQAVCLAEKLDHAEWTAWGEFSLGWTLLELFAVEQAIEHLQRGLAASERAGALNHLVRCASHLAWALWLGGDARGALAAVERAEEVFRQITAPPGMAFVQGAHAYVAIGRVHLACGEAERAIRLVLPILSAADACGWQEAIALGLLVIGQCLMSQRDRRGAEAALRRALEVAVRVGLQGIAWEVHEAMASLCMASGRSAKAHDHLTQARGILEHLATTIHDEGIRQRFVGANLSRLERAGSEGGVQP